MNRSPFGKGGVLETGHVRIDREHLNRWQSFRMTKAQKMLRLYDQHGVHISPMIRTVVSMDGSGSAVRDGDALALLRMCARSAPRSIRLMTDPQLPADGPLAAG